MSDYISKWHKELEIFSKIKPLLILEGDVLDSSAPIGVSALFL